MTDPILVTGEDLELYSESKLKEMRAKIKGCVPEKKALPSKEKWPSLYWLQRGENVAIDQFTANLIAAGLMEDSNTRSQLTNKEQ